MLETLTALAAPQAILAIQAPQVLQVPQVIQMPKLTSNAVNILEIIETCLKLGLSSAGATCAAARSSEISPQFGGWTRVVCTKRTIFHCADTGKIFNKLYDNFQYSFLSIF